MLKRCAWVLFVWILGLSLSSCGGGGSGPTGNLGRAVFTIDWPERSRLIPAACNSIQIQILQGSEPLVTRVLPRPATGSQTTAVFANLRVGALTVTASALPNADGTGVPQAEGSTPLTIVSGQTATVTLTMASTITELSIAPASPSFRVGKAVPLTATGKDVLGRVVLTAPSKLTWTSSNNAAATVDATGIVTGINPGGVTITVTDSESGKSATTTGTVNRIEMYAYTTEHYAHKVWQHRVNDDGTLTALNPPTVPADAYPYNLAGHPNGRYLYVVNSHTTSVNGTISQYRVGDDGTLSPLTPPTVTTGAIYPVAICIDPTGRYAYVANYSGKAVSQFRINADGTLAPMSPATLPTFGEAVSLTLDQSGSYLYVSTFGAGVRQFIVSGDGSLTENGRFAPFMGPAFGQSIAADPKGPHVYATSMAAFDGISQMGIGAGGALFSLNPKTASPELEPRDLAVTPDGKYLYMIDKGDVFGAYRINSDGTLTAFGSRMNGPNGSLAIDPTGQFLYVPSTDSIKQYRIGADGTPNLITPNNAPYPCAGMAFIQR